jgi:uncharacterized membrane protein YtjA (UPF0391 family)
LLAITTTGGFGTLVAMSFLQNKSIYVGSDRSLLTDFRHSVLGKRTMLNYAILFLIIALIAGAMGFGLVGGMAYGAAKICFFVFLVLAVISLLRGRSVRV